MLGRTLRKKATLRYRRRNGERTWAGLGCRTWESGDPEEGAVGCN